MKTNFQLGFRNVSVALILFFAFTLNALAQPQHYNFATGGGANSFPFNQPSGKLIQTLLKAGDFNTPSPAPSGMAITKYYVRIASTYPLGPATYTNFSIRFSQTALTVLPTGSYYTGTWATVYNRASVTLTAAADTWLEFTLDTPYPYDPSMSLVVEIINCGASGTTTGFSLAHTTVAAGNNGRTYSVTGPCPQVYQGISSTVVNCGIDVAPAGSPFIPDVLYYKFDENVNATTVRNCAIPGAGTPTAPITSTTLTPGGQFDSCLTSTFLSNAGVNTGWNCNLGAGSWTISMWLTIPTTSSGSAFYLFGDGGSTSFRCFHNGVALPDNLVLRGPLTDVTVTGIGPTPTVVTFVYDSAAAQIKAYKNGVLAVTSNQTINMPTGSGFRVGGYGTSTGFAGKMDEFRLYRRALTPAEVTEMWNSDPGGCGLTGITTINSEIPATYTLSQNYPNPFNPVTNIKFSIPKSEFVKIVIFDVLGREVANLVNDQLTAGLYNVDFDASNLSSGAYFYRIEAGSFIQTKKMLLVK